MFIHCTYVAYLGWRSNLFDACWRRSADDWISRVISRTSLLPCGLFTCICLAFITLLSVSAQATEQEQDMHCFVPPPPPPLFKLPLLLLENLHSARTWSAIPLLKQGLPCLTMALRCRKIIPSRLCLLPLVVDHNLKGDCQEGVNIMKVIRQIYFIRLVFKDVLDLEMIRKDSNAHQVQLTNFFTLSFDFNVWSSQLTNRSSFLSIASQMIACQCEYRHLAVKQRT